MNELKHKTSTIPNYQYYKKKLLPQTKNRVERRKSIYAPWGWGK